MFTVELLEAVPATAFRFTEIVVGLEMFAGMYRLLLSPVLEKRLNPVVEPALLVKLQL